MSSFCEETPKAATIRKLRHQQKTPPKSTILLGIRSFLRTFLDTVALTFFFFFALTFKQKETACDRRSFQNDGVTTQIFYTRSYLCVNRTQISQYKWYLDKAEIMKLVYKGGKR